MCDNGMMAWTPWEWVVFMAALCCVLFALHSTGVLQPRGFSLSLDGPSSTAIAISCCCCTLQRISRRPLPVEMVPTTGKKD
jgi:hypothetical protein